MADNSSDEEKRRALIASLEHTQNLLRQTLGRTSAPIEAEAKVRFQVADILIKTIDQSQHEPFIYDAIEHLDFILQKLPRASPDYPKYLNSLCKARTSEYMLLGGSSALDEAVRAGREALDLNTSTNVHDRDLEEHASILLNLSFALSRRHALLKDLKDLDAAISHTRMLYEEAPKDSDRYVMSLNNLVSQLRRRIQQEYDVDLETEASALLNELATSTTPGTLHHGIAVGQMGMIAVEKFQHTNSLEDLNKALEHCKTALQALPPNHEVRLAMLTNIVHLYRSKEKFEKDARDLERLIHYSGLLFEATPSGHPSRGRHLLEYIQIHKQHLKTTSSVQEIDNGIQKINEHLCTMSGRFRQKESCQNVISDLFMMRYALTTEMKDLIFLLSYLEGVAAEHNSNLGKPGPERTVSTDWMWSLKSDLNRVGKAHDENNMGEVAQKELFGIFTSYFEPVKASIDVLGQMYEDYGVRLHIIADAIEADKSLSSEELDLEMEKVQKERNDQNFADAPRSVSVNETYTAFGNRTLAIDEESGDIMWDFDRNMLLQTLGYDPSEPLSLSKHEFIDRERRMERRAIETAKSEGRNPNLNLCRMCRDIAKPLQPTKDGYHLTAKDIFLPFGNIYQLYCRKNCAVCRLILSAIMADTGGLHPQLETIDPEVQGTRLSTGTLPSGEIVMRIEYGLKHVGDIRLITPQNYREAIRQAKELTSPAPLEEAIKARAGPIQSQAGQQVDTELLKAWLDDCDRNHCSTCSSARVHDNNEEMSMMFIDVVKNCLVAATSREKYFALSYVWGSVDMFKTMKDNCEQRKESQGLSGIPFPKTIQDAITLVKSLGERYLWVDAICMVQDDKEKMAADIPKMNIVYGRAFATIAALHGDSADAGLPGVSPGTRRPQHVEYLRVSNGSPYLDYDVGDEKSSSICLVATPRPLNLEQDIAKWNTRGWIFQERLLSRRCLYFSPKAVYFQCATHTLSECGLNEEYTSMMFDKTPQKPRPASARAARDNALDRLTILPSLASEQEKVHHAFCIYKDMVQSYTRREFTCKSDIINGFAGVFSVLEKHFQSKMYSGLPAVVLAHSLLWCPAARIPIRGMRLPTPSDMSMGKPDMQFPSWSWAGWDGPVEYRLFDYMQQTTPFPEPLLTHHTLGNKSLPDNVEQADGSQQSSETSTKTSVDASVSVNLDSKGLPGNKTGSAPETPPKGNEMSVDDKPFTIPPEGRMLGDPSRGTVWTVLPPQPMAAWDPPLDSNMLSFTAPTVPISRFRISPEKEYLIHQHHTHTAGNQAVRRIYDGQGNHCGLWWEQAGYGYVGLSQDAKAEREMHMVGLSAYGDTDHRRKGLSRVEGEIDLFDSSAFLAAGPDSGLVNILVVKVDLEDELAAGRRVTVAVLHRKAWEKAGPTESDLRLA